ncbi:MAG: hypothetical protein GX045_11845 [Clostridiaceae bacterium]|jgi:DhnA family fructose-bisphosphate aldolase class Ia|nr:hypothetical protein [Clostridiaceae bacterium]
MNGLKRNIAKLFNDRNKLFVLAMDHAQCGVSEGLEKPDLLLKSLSDSPIDGFILNVGLADRMGHGELLNKKLILRTSFGGSMMSTEYSNVHTNHVSPETALRLGADAVLMMFVMGGADYRSIQDAAAAIDAYHYYGIPVIAEILCDDLSKTNSPEIQMNGARVAAELGADVVKAFYTENFNKVTENCPVPVILAGGPKGSDIIDIARNALNDGAKGFAFGRNIFQSSNPAEVIRQLDTLFD